MKHNPLDIYSIGGLRILLRDECEKAGGIRAWSRVHKISPAFVSLAIRGKRKPGPTLLRVLGLEPSTVYVPVQRRRPENGRASLE